MQSSPLKHLFSWQRLLAGLSGVCFGIVVTHLTDLFAGKNAWVTAIAAVIAVLAWVLSPYFEEKNIDIDVDIRSPKTMRTDVDVMYNARSGFVGFVPIFNPKKDSPASQLSIDERLQAAQNHEFDRLHLEESNLEPTITAIRTHARYGKLKHCWLLATEGKRASGSLPYAHLIADYLRHSGVDCEFYVGDRYAISLDDDALVLIKTYDLVRQTFAEATRLGIPPRSLVADITTGFRSMTLGMVLACLAGERDIEFIGTRYDELGIPEKGNLTPIIFSFEPHVNPGDR